MLIARGKISREMMAMLATWRHSGFHVFSRKSHPAGEASAMENPARYIIPASFSQERMQDLGSEGSVIYSAKNSTDRKVFDARDERHQAAFLKNRGAISG